MQVKKEWLLWWTNDFPENEIIDMNEWQLMLLLDHRGF